MVAIKNNTRVSRIVWYCLSPSDRGVVDGDASQSVLLRLHYHLLVPAVAAPVILSGRKGTFSCSISLLVREGLSGLDIAQRLFVVTFATHGGVSSNWLLSCIHPSHGLSI